VWLTKSSRKVIGLQFTLRQIFSHEDKHIGVVKCEFWVEKSPRRSKIAMIELLYSMLQPDLIRDKLFVSAGPSDDAALD
jgi:hypothetical protein